MAVVGFPKCPLCIYDVEAGLGEDIVMVPVSEKGEDVWICLKGLHRVTSSGLEVKRGDTWVLYKP